MHAVVPAAGRGTRLRPLTSETPKGLIEVAGTPILTHCFEHLVELGIDEIIVIVGYEGQQIIDHYGDAFDGVPLTYAWQEQRRGLAHALVQARDHVEGAFLVVNGDNVFGRPPGQLLDAYLEADADGAVYVESVSIGEARTTGVVELADGRVVDLTEKADEPPSTLANAGCYVLPEAIFQACDLLQPGAEGEYQLSDAVGVLCRAGYEFVPVELDGWRVNVNTPGDIERAEAKISGCDYSHE
ncbi:sugar phosphate nucleotidyltransferase [Natronoarchaeum sp. GCM10025703]|uniref:sugar phosphate nucleotidyltransferase n=1 Tax=unclassified Natronoarchaeum TaxID=2620183 RepID=UPI0036122A41